MSPQTVYDGDGTPAAATSSMLTELRRGHFDSFPKCGADEENNLKDLVDKLPADVLIAIVVRLSVKEAARTSIISHKWRYLWRFLEDLDFDEVTLVRDIRLGLSTKTIETERKKFVNWVNQVLELHQAPTINLFGLSLDPEGFDASVWINFAIQKRVKVLELNFMHCGHFIDQGKTYCPSTESLANRSFDSLTCLRLNSVEITEDDAECILSSCPNLEHLSLSEIYSLGYLTISVPDLKLRCLEVIGCRKLRDLIISEINPVSFKYDGASRHIKVEKASRLVELCLLERVSGSAVLKFTFFSWLLALELCEFFPNYRHLANLKHLEIQLDGRDIAGLFDCVFLLEAAPLLHKFVLKLSWMDQVGRCMPSPREHIYFHQHLKVFEIVGYFGCYVDMELTWYLVDQAPSLQKLIIDTRNPVPPENILELECPRDVTAARTRVSMLKEKLPPQVELVIL